MVLSIDERWRSRLFDRALHCVALSVSAVTMTVWLQGCIPLKTGAGISPQAAFNIDLDAGQKIAILFSPDADPNMSNAVGEQMADCVYNSVSKAARPITVLKQGDAYAALFPGLSPKQVLIRSDTLPLLVSQPGIRERIDRLQLRYLILVGGYTEEYARRGGIYIPGTSLLVLGWDFRVELIAHVFELGRGTEVGAVGSAAKSGGYAGIILFLPFVVASFDAEGSACEALGAGLLRVIGAPTNDK